MEYIAIVKNPYSFANDTDFFLDPITNSIIKIPCHLSIFIKYCYEFKTIEEHAGFIYSKISKTISIQEIIKHLNFFINKKILISREEIINLIKANKSIQKTDKIKYLGYVTSGRSPELQLSIESYIKYSKSYNKNLAMIICDDSKKNGEVLKNFYEIKSKNNVDIYYFGRDQKQKFIERLYKDLKDLVKKEILQFMISDTFYQYACGANRNALLLASAGSNIVSCDDDILFESYVSKIQNNNEIDLTSQKRVMEILFYDNKKDLFDFVEPIDLDIINEHESFLGKNASEIISLKENSSISIKEIKYDFLLSLIRDDSSVKITMPGIIGSSGMGSPSPILWIPDEQKERVFSSKKMYESSICSNEVFRAPDKIKISDNNFLMSYNIGLNNQEFLPPFFPIGRGTESIFNSILRKIFLNSCICYMPFAVNHDPMKRKIYNHESVYNFSNNFSDILVFLIDSFNISDSIRTPEYRLNVLGNYFKEISNLRQIDFISLITSLIIKQSSDFIKFLESLLIKYDAKPKFWAEDIYKLIENIEKSINGQDLYFPKELDNINICEDKEKSFKKILNLFGDLLISWESIYNASKKYNQQSIAFVKKL